MSDTSIGKPQYVFPPRRSGLFPSVPNFSDHNVTPYLGDQSVRDSIALFNTLDIGDSSNPDRAPGPPPAKKLKSVAFQGSAMDEDDAKWYGDFMSSTLSHASTSVQAASSSADFSVSDNAVPNDIVSSSNTTRPNRVLRQMDSGQALEVYMQRSPAEQGGAGDID